MTTTTKTLETLRAAYRAIRLSCCQQVGCTFRAFDERASRLAVELADGEEVRAEDFLQAARETAYYASIGDREIVRLLECGTAVAS